MNDKLTNYRLCYLMFGDDIEEIINSSIYITSKYDIFFFVVANEFHVIKSKEEYFCSCNDMQCWHIAKVIIESDTSIYKEHLHG